MATYSNLFLDSNRGIYLPQHFADMIDPQDWTGIDAEDLEILKSGPSNESYGDAWQSVLDLAETKDGQVLHQDGDLWLVAKDKAIEDLNAYFSDCLEYETRHGDAGDAYGHLVEDVDLEDLKRQLEDEKMVKDPENGDLLGYSWVKKLDLDLKGLDLDTVARLALEVFTMQPGHTFGPFEDGLVLAGFSVQEIEIEIPEEFDGIVLELIGDHGTDAYITGTGRAYIATDAVWYAVASVKDLQDAIDSEVLQDA